MTGAEGCHLHGLDLREEGRGLGCDRHHRLERAIGDSRQPLDVQRLRQQLARRPSCLLCRGHPGLVPKPLRHPVLGEEGRVVGLELPAAKLNVRLVVDLQHNNINTFNTATDNNNITAVLEGRTSCALTMLRSR